jgi:hypothetical protein
MTEAARFLRQVLLPEIGLEGQARIVNASAAVAGPTLANELAELYARGAGFGRIEAGDIDIDALAPSAILRVAAARELCAGARAALAAMREAVLVKDGGGAPSREGGAFVAGSPGGGGGRP